MILNEIQVKKAVSYTSAAASNVNGDVIDSASAESVAFVVRFGTAAADNTIKVQQGTLANGSDMADLEGSSVAVGASDEIVACEIVKPRERYLRVVVLRGTSSTIETGFALIGGLRVQPADNADAGTIASEKLISPPEGTA
jgi:hypothetical protein